MQKTWIHARTKHAMDENKLNGVIA